MDLQNSMNSRFGVGLALALGRITPEIIGYRLAASVADLISARRSSRIVRAVRANQWVIAGGKLTPQQLDRAVRDTFRHAGRCIYDHYHHIYNPSALLDMVAFSPEFERRAQSIKEGKTGTLFVTPHLSNFDLMGRALALKGFNIQVLSYADPRSGYKEQNRLRTVGGFEFTPISLSALRRATDALHQGGTILTGLDRPEKDPKYRLEFFGRLAPLPVGHIRLALKTKVPITAVAAQMRPDGTYYLLATDPIPMQPYPDPVEEITRNAEVVLRVVEEWIRQAPHQWLMFYPVWPEVINEII
ncbi:MAG: lysophospholipid acyltransferase family protein [Chloroflexi bacterium]|nr:lysophospholipid acyltransferase family protein [Chloroflexota bacterium]